MSRPGRPLSLADEAYVRLRRRLTRCEIAPGTAFTAKDVAAELGLGLTPVREALLQLGRDRLVDTLPRRGYIATPLTPSRVGDVLTTWRIVKPQVAALAVRRAAPEAVPDLAARLQGVFEQRLGPPDEPQMAVAESRSAAWLLLAAQTGNEVLTEIVRFLDGQVLRVQLCAARRDGAPTGPDAAALRAGITARDPSWAVVLRDRDEAAAAERAAAEIDLFSTVVRARTAAGAGPPPQVAPPRTSPADHAWQHLRDRIVRGDLPAGTRLTERFVSAHLGVGLTPVREALGRLDHERLVVTRPRLGYVVTGTTPQDAAHTAEAWAMLVPDLVELAVRHASPAQARAVVEALADPTGTPGDLVLRRMAGWRLLARATGNTVLAETFELLDGVLARLAATLLRRTATPVDPSPADWAGLFARRDPQEARAVATAYVGQMRRITEWATQHLPPAQIYQPSRHRESITAT